MLIQTVSSLRLSAVVVVSAQHTTVFYLTVRIVCCCFCFLLIILNLMQQKDVLEVDLFNSVLLWERIKWPQQVEFCHRDGVAQQGDIQAWRTSFLGWWWKEIKSSFLKPEMLRKINVFVAHPQLFSFLPTSSPLKPGKNKNRRPASFLLPVTSNIPPPPPPLLLFSHLHIRSSSSS